MMTRFTRILTIGALAAFASRAPAAEEPDSPTITLGLDDVLSFPETYQRIPFDIALLYHGPREIYNPYFTLFEPSAFLNFAAWPADAPVFSREGYAADYPLFYVDRRSSDLQMRVLAMKPCTWFDARCIVRSTAQGRAWIEVLAISNVHATLPSADLRHLVRANSLAARGEFDRALLELDLASMAGAPPQFVARCRGEEGRIALAANQPERAAAALQQAQPWVPRDAELAALLDSAETAVESRRQQELASVPASRPPPLQLQDLDAASPAAGERDEPTAEVSPAPGEEPAGAPESATEPAPATESATEPAVEVEPVAVEPVPADADETGTPADATPETSSETEVETPATAPVEGTAPSGEPVEELEPTDRDGWIDPQPATDAEPADATEGADVPADPAEGDEVTEAPVEPKDEAPKDDAPKDETPKDESEGDDGR